MRPLLLAAAALALLGPAAGAAQAADETAGQPAQPAQMADTWRLQSHGRVLCTLKLSGASQGGVYGLRPTGDCGGVLPASVVGWRPTAHGVAFVSQKGSPVLTFGRWSESLYVASRPGEPDIQISRADHD